MQIEGAEAPSRHLFQRRHQRLREWIAWPFTMEKREFQRCRQLHTSHQCLRDMLMELSGLLCRPNAEAAMSQNEMDHHNRSDCKSTKKWLQGNLKKRILATSGRSCLREVA